MVPLAQKVPPVAAVVRTVGLLVCILAGAVAVAEPHREAMGNDHVIVRYWPRNEDKARIALDAAGSAIQSLQAELNMTFDGQITIDIASTHQEFNEITGARQGEWVMGQAFYDRRWIVVKAVGDLNLRQLVAHEVCHILLGEKLAKSGAEAPRWLHEGLAQYTAGQWTSDSMQIIGQAAASGTLIPLAKLDEAFGGKVEQVSLAYAESYTLVAFLEEQEGQKGLGDFVDELGRTDDVGRALVRTYRMTPEQLEHAWMESVRLRYMRRGFVVADELWVFIIFGVLFIAAVIVQRRKARRIRERLQEEEMQRLLAEIGAYRPSATGDDDEEGEGPQEHRF